MTAGVDLARARELFDDDALRWIVDRLRTRLERGRPLDARLRLDEPSDRQREATLALLGRRPTTARSISIDPTELAIVLAEAGIAPDLATLVEALDGPVVDRKAAAAAEQAAWDAVHRRLRQSAAALDQRLAGWVDELESIGLLRRLAGDVDAADRLAEHAVAVLQRLPADGVPLAQVAATSVGDSHALDDASPLSTLLFRALEVLTGMPRRDRGASERRALWARVAVLVDELSGPALVLGLRPADAGLLARSLRAHAEAGEPCRITLRQLVRHTPDWSALTGPAVAVCENPAVVAAAADRLGAGSPPLVCTDGQPSGAVQTLLRQLAGAGATLRFHTDFDGGGIRIGNLLRDRFGATPWRMGHTDYESAAAAAGVPLTGEPDEACWDAKLTPAMAARGRAVHEEQVLEVLLADLAVWVRG